MKPDPRSAQPVLLRKSDALFDLDFEPLLLWLKQEAVYKSYSPDHFHHDDNPKWAARMAAYTNPDDGGFPKYPGDYAVTQLPEGETISSAGIKNPIVKSAHFSSYAGMLAKILHPDVLRTWLEEEAKNPAYDKEGSEIIDPLSPKLKKLFDKEPMLFRAIYQFENSLINYGLELSDKVAESDHFTPDERFKAQLTVATMMSAGFEAGLIHDNFSESIANAYLERNHITENLPDVLPPVTQEDFRVGAANVLKKERFKSGGTRCPAESIIMQLSALSSEHAVDGAKPGFGTAMWELYNAMKQRQAGKAAQVSPREEKPYYLKRSLSGDDKTGKCPFQR